MKPTASPTGNAKTLLALVTCLLLVIGVLLHEGFFVPNRHLGTQKTQPAASPQAVAGANTEQALITYVVDGDTIKISGAGNQETVRLIGVDTPETKDPRKTVQCFGEQAAAYTNTQLIHKTVSLVADPTQQNRDKYGRLLRYVFLPDGSLFNLQLLTNGYAYEYTYDTPYEYQTAFKQAATEAKTQQLGLWSVQTCNGKR